jgi:hypothetical protein
MSNPIYIPAGCKTLEVQTGRAQIRLGLQGFPGTGKTWSALTFNNPIVANTDRGLGAHQGRKDVVDVPFYDIKFAGRPETAKDVLIRWLETEAIKLTNEQTLVWDSLTATEVLYHLWFRDNEQKLAYTKNGQKDSFVEWSLKTKFFEELFALFKSLSCDIVIISHESEQQDKSTTPGQPGGYSGKIRPLYTGAMKDKLTKDFTDWFRQLSCAKPKDDALTPEVLANWKMTKDEFKAMLNTFPGTTLYFWQSQGDDLFDAKASSLVNPPKYLPATFSAFAKYMRK